MTGKIGWYYMLDASEMERLIAHSGGLWGQEDMAREFGPSARNWVRAKGFPSPAWRTGRRSLYVGCEVLKWLEDTERFTDWLAMRRHVRLMKKEKRQM